MNKPDVRQALSDLLKALGFVAMARDVQTETYPARINRYARIIVKNTPEGALRRQAVALFHTLRLL